MTDEEMIESAAGALGAEIVNLPPAIRTVAERGPKYPDVSVRLTDRDGNAFAIIGAVSRALRRAVGPDVAGRWTRTAWKCGSYDALLMLALEWVNVE